VSPVSTVLLVDDDEDLREVLSEFLLMEGARCVAAASLAQVEAQAGAALATQLAILDVNLGLRQPSGVEVCRWLREHGFAGPIVFLTGHAATDPRVVEASSQPNTRVISKPVGSDTIADLVASGR
jgi:DNA-binding response OmpR family regulator